MLGFQKIIISSLLCVTLSMSTSDSKDNFLWTIFNHGKSILTNLKNSERRTDSAEGQDQGPYAETPEHRGTEEGHHVAYDNYYGDYYPSHTQVIHRDNMELYSLLGGLSFASLLATTLIILTRRNGSLFRSSQDTLFRKNGDQEQDQEYEMVIKVPEFMYRIGRILSRPWWSPSVVQRDSSKSLSPITLTYPQNHDPTD